MPGAKGAVAGLNFLVSVLEEKGMGYDELIFALING